MYFYNTFKAVTNILLFILLILATSCKETRTMEVTATAYNSVERQTKKGDPFTAAWGDKLKPGMKAIAVSRDLIPVGLDHKTEVSIEGLKGKYVVLDKMNKRWRQKIDIYMGLDEQKARNWGKRKVNISWTED
jgi:3D (Asp-Asp-Asp) domain-containing protein